jgi:hypothetical protein
VVEQELVGETGSHWRMPSTGGTLQASRLRCLTGNASLEHLPHKGAFVRAIRLILLLVVQALPVQAQVRWETMSFGEACHPRQRFELPVGSKEFEELGRLNWIGPNRIAVAQQRAARIQVLDGNLKPLFSFGRKGNGPGELQMPSDVAVIADSMLAVTDPMQMRVHLYTLSGKFIRSFLTSRFPPQRILSLPDGRIAVAGLSNVLQKNQFLSIHGMDGARVASALDAPEPYGSMAPRVGDVTLLRRRDGSLVVVPAGLDTVFTWSQGSEAHFGLSLPAGFWNQVTGMDVNQPHEKLMAAFNKTSYIGNGTMITDSILAFGWRTGEKLSFAMLNIDRRRGVLLKEAPGWIYGINGGVVYVRTEDLDDRSVMQSFACTVPASLN